jgi:exopolyphosphatase/guanosine-5'-triphosphate,3'-diphosphate pyrophosphatase
MIRAQLAKQMSKVFATIDLGSNSFHLLIVRVSQDKHQRVVLRRKQQVKLRDGISSDGGLTEAAQKKALACFKRFSNFLRDHRAEHVRIVGTYTLRTAINIDGFIAESEKVLGHKINIVNGEEEARLVFVGATRSRSFRRKNLLIDIGGGSTELVIGQDQNILCLTSLNIGCVSSQSDFFTNGSLSRASFDKAIKSIKEIISPIQKQFLDVGFINCLGSSGTIRSIASILLEAGWSRGIIDIDGLVWLRLQLQDFKNVKNIRMPGLRSDRESILPGGLAILTALFELLEIKKLSISRGAIREGVLFELIEEFL